MGTNGNLAIVLDPIGYYYAEEEGIAFQWDANDLWAHGVLKPEDHFWSADQSPWLLPQALQFQENWWQSPLRVAHLLPESQWTFGPNVSHRPEYVNQKEVGVSVNAGDASMGIYVAFNAGGAPIDINIDSDGTGKTSLSTALYNATGGNVIDPATFVVAACTNAMIDGRKTPFLRVGGFPKPDEPFAFGFGSYALVFTRRAFYLLKTTNDHQNWVYLGGTHTSGKWLRHAVQKEYIQHGIRRPFGPPPTTVYDHDVIFQDFGIVPVGYDHLFLASLGGEGHMFQVRQPILPRSPKLNCFDHVGAGKWWFACSVGRQLFVQVEKTAYGQAEHVKQTQIDESNPPTDPPDEPWVEQVGPLMFNMGKGYNPSPQPQLFVDGLVHGGASGSGDQVENDVSELLDSGRRYGKQVTNSATNESLTVSLYTPHLKKFNNSSGGTEKAHAGYLRITLTPATDNESAPQLCLARIRFPELVLPRVRSTPSSETIISEFTEGTEEGVYAANVHWQSLKVGCAYHDLLGKVMVFEIVETVYQPGQVPLADLETALTPYYKRQKFPVEVREDTNGDSVYETVRIAAWVDKIEIVQVKWNDFDNDGKSDTVTRVFRFQCHGLAKRLDQPWLYLPSVEDMEGDQPSIANGSRLTHLGSIQKALTQGGFIISSPGVFAFDDDSTEPDDLRYLPGDSLSMEAVAGMRKRKNTYAPEPDQKRAHYMQHVAHNWAGRALFEKLDGRICYLYDLIQRIYQYGSNPDLLPVPRAVFYRSHQEAINNAGVELSWNRVPGLFMLETPSPVFIPQPVQGNCVRVAAKSATGDLEAITILKDLKSIHGDPVVGAAYENFIGEPKIVSLNLKDLAVNAAAANRVAHEFLLELGLRGELFQFATPFLPWQMTNITPPLTTNASLDVGDPVGCDGYGQFIIIHAETALEIHSRGTIFTAWKYPTPLQPYT